MPVWAHLHDPAVIAKRAATMKARWADPEQRAILFERTQFQSAKAKSARAAAMQRDDVRAKMSEIRTGRKTRRALHPNFKAETRAKWIAANKSRVHTPEEHAKREASRSVAMAKRRSRQAEILTDMERRMGLTPACRDVELLAEVLTMGVFRHDLSAYLGCHPNVLKRWLRGAARPKGNVVASVVVQAPVAPSPAPRAPLGPFGWNANTVARLRDLWAAGLSAADIGERLGCGKDAVIGKAHRLGLPARSSPIVRSAEPKVVHARPLLRGASTLAALA